MDPHTGLQPAVHAARSVVLADTDTAHPERFVRQIPQPPTLPTAVWINKPGGQ
jgi:putative transposase